MDSFFISAPGKVILFGEHAVVHEKVSPSNPNKLTIYKAAIATSVSLRSYLLVQVKPTTESNDPQITLNFPDIGLNHSWPISDLPLLPSPSPTAPSALNVDLVKSLQPLLEPFAHREFQHVAAFAFLYLYTSLSPARPGQNTTFLLRSAIPIGSGLGSSASISVCLATALLKLGGYIPCPEDAGRGVLKTINEWAYLGEKCIHGNPSGVDNTVATFGGGVVFRKERRPIKLANGIFTAYKPAENLIIKSPPSRLAMTSC